MIRPHEKNGFDALRLTAALMVIYSHSSLIGFEKEHPFQIFGYDTYGSVAVSIFFAISGYLVTQSWLADPSLSRYFVKRCLRIFPALIAVVVCSALFVGPWMTTLSLADYFRNHETWSYFKNIALFFRQDSLPEVFTTNPGTHHINGSLWTLPYEFTCYGFAALCGVVYFYRGRFRHVILVVSFLACFTGFSYVVTVDIFRHIEAFVVGALLATEDAKLLSRTLLYIGLLALALLTIVKSDVVYLAAAFIAVASILSGRFLKIPLRNDYSYGIYLWSYVVQQTLAIKYPTLDKWTYIAAATAISFGVAILSWHLIEKRALKFKPSRPGIA